MSDVSRSRNGPLWLLLAAMLSTLAAGFGTRLVLERDYFRYLLVFDITQSMNVRDPVPVAGGHTRLDRSKLAAQELLTRLPCGSSMGLGIFTQHRTLLLINPLEVCGHYGEIQTMLADIHGGMAWRARSEIAKGIHSAVAITAEMKPQTRLVFFSDGHEAPPVHPDFPPPFTGDPGKVQGLLAGVGGKLPLPIPKFDAAGSQVGVWGREEVMQVDVYSLGRPGDVPGEAMAGVEVGNLAQRMASGTEHLSSLREDYLRQLAAGLGLDYRSLESADALGEVLTSRRYAFQHRAVHDVHAWLGSLALVLILLIYLIYSRRVEGSKRRRRVAGGP